MTIALTRRAATAIGRSLTGGHFPFRPSSQPERLVSRHALASVGISGTTSKKTAPSDGRAFRSGIDLPQDVSSPHAMVLPQHPEIRDVDDHGPARRCFVSPHPPRRERSPRRPPQMSRFFSITAQRRPRQGSHHSASAPASTSFALTTFVHSAYPIGVRWRPSCLNHSASGAASRPFSIGAEMSAKWRSL